MSLVLGLDVSTTATKAVLVDRTGAVVATTSSPHTVDTPHPGWSEQEPRIWWDAAVASIRDVLAEAGRPGDDVACIGLAGQMHGLTMIDAAGEVVRPALLWNDQRTAAECDEIRDRVGRERLIAITGNDALTGFTAPKVLWVRNNEPELFARVDKIMLPKDYVRYRLSGVVATDLADGSGTVLMDVAERRWSEEICRLLEIDTEWLPEVFEGSQVTAHVSAAAAELTGLRTGTPIVAGAGDQAGNAVGTGAVDPGTATISVGTSGVVFVPTAEPVVQVEGRIHSFCHAVPERWHAMGVMLSAAGSLSWLHDALVMDDVGGYDRLIAEAEKVPAGSEGLRFLPYLSGERTPHPDPDARGAFVGLTVRHGRGHLTRAVLEGVAFGLRDSLELLRDSGVTLERSFISGGGTRSDLWLQIIADTLQVELVSGTTEGAAYGAALLATVGGAEWFDTVQDAVKACVTTNRTVEPDAGDGQRYDEAYATYRRLYPQLRESLHALAAEEAHAAR